MLDTSALLLSLAVSLLGADQPVSLVRNGGLEASVAWNLASATLEATGNPGRCISCSDRGGATQEVLVARRELTLTVAVDAKVEGVQPEPGKRGYAFAAVYQTDELGNLVRSHDFIQEIGTATWQRKSYTFTVDPKADYVSLRCGLFQATGKAWFDNWTLVAGPESKRLDEVQEPRCRPNSPKGVAAILDEPGMPIHGTASSPETIARILSGAGLETRRLSAVELADPTVLNPTRFHLVVVLTGQTFPAAARLTFREFLRSGGGLITMGGYAFNQQVRKVENQWLGEEGLVQTQLEQAMAADRSLLSNGGFEKDQTLRPGAADVSGQWHGASGRCAMVAEAAKEGRFGRPGDRARGCDGRRGPTGRGDAGQAKDDVSVVGLDANVQRERPRHGLHGPVPVRCQGEARRLPRFRYRSRHDRLAAAQVRRHARTIRRSAEHPPGALSGPRHGLV